MEFVIEASCTPESKLLATYPCLKNFKFYEKEETVSCNGYVRDTVAYGTIVEYGGEKYVKLDGSELLTPISLTKNKKTPKICIDTLEDLMNLMKMIEMPIIIDSDGVFNANNCTIEIYDGYRE